MKRAKLSPATKGAKSVNMKIQDTKPGVWPLVERAGPRARRRGTGHVREASHEEPCFSNWQKQLGCEYPPFGWCCQTALSMEGSSPAWGEEALESWEACLFPFRLASGTWGVGVRPRGTHAPLQPVLEGAFSKGGQGWPELETKVAGREDKRPSWRQVSAAAEMGPCCVFRLFLLPLVFPRWPF